MKIRNQLTLWFTLQVALIVATGSLLGWFGLRRSVYSDVTQEVRDKTKEITLFIQATAKDMQKRQQKFDLSTNDFIRQYIFSNYHTHLYGNIFLQLTSGSHRPLMRSANLEQINLPVLKSGTIGKLTISLPRKAHLQTLYANSPLLLEGTVIGHLQVAVSLAKPERYLSNLMWYEFLGFILSVCVSLLLGQKLAEQALAPMLKVTHQVQSMTEGLSLFKRLDVASLPRDEIGHLAETFNSLLSRLEHLFAQQKQFAEDASHELKSPLTAIRGHAQLLEKRGLSHTAIFNESVATIHREAERLTRLIDDLLLLARMEKQPQQLHPLNIKALLQQLLQEMCPIYPQLQGPETPRDAWLNGDETELKRVFINLLDNAIRAAGESGHVHLHWESIGNHVAIYVSDNGPGISETHLNRIFERFYRAEPARDRNSGGSGLGLSIVHEIVQRHMGSVSVSSKMGEGTTFTVLLPAPLVPIG